MERTTVDNSEHDYGGQQLQNKTSIVKNPWNRIKTLSDCVYYPFTLLSLQQRSKASKKSAGSAKITELQIQPENRT